jgi:hypothetical protein
LFWFAKIFIIVAVEIWREGVYWTIVPSIVFSGELS